MLKITLPPERAQYGQTGDILPRSPWKMRKRITATKFSSFNLSMATMECELIMMSSNELYN